MESEVNEQRLASMLASTPTAPKPSKEAKMETTALPNWHDLPRDVTAKILHRLGPIEILTSAQFVCPLWQNISKDPAMWRTIDIRSRGTSYVVKNKLVKMCCHAIGRSCGQLEDISIETFGTNSLLKYIVDSKVRRMRLAHCSDISSQALSEAAKKLPLLEELEISYSYLSKDCLEAVRQGCPLLKVLKFIRKCKAIKGVDYDDEAFAIAKNVPNLRHLQLLRNDLTNAGLLAILDGCPHLESLDLRGCFTVNLRSSLGKRCAEQIKELRVTYDYLDESSDDDYDDPYADLYCDGGLAESSEDEESFAYKVAEYYGLL